MAKLLQKLFIILQTFSLARLHSLLKKRAIYIFCVYICVSPRLSFLSESCLFIRVFIHYILVVYWQFPRFFSFSVFLLCFWASNGIVGANSAFIPSCYMLFLDLVLFFLAFWIQLLLEIIKPVIFVFTFLNGVIWLAILAGFHSDFKRGFLSATMNKDIRIKTKDDLNFYKMTIRLFLRKVNEDRCLINTANILPLSIFYA